MSAEQMYCPVIENGCAIVKASHRSCFVAIPYSPFWKDTRDTIIGILKKFSVKPYLADEDVAPGKHILCKICQAVSQSWFGVIEISSQNPNVMLELGLSIGRRKSFFILCSANIRENQKDGKIIPSDISGLERIEYQNQSELKKRFESAIKRFIEELPQRRWLERARACGYIV